MSSNTEDSSSSSSKKKIVKKIKKTTKTIVAKSKINNDIDVQSDKIQLDKTNILSNKDFQDLETNINEYNQTKKISDKLIQYKELQLKCKTMTDEINRLYSLINVNINNKSIDSFVITEENIGEAMTKIEELIMNLQNDTNLLSLEEQVNNYNIAMNLIQKCKEFHETLQLKLHNI